MKLRLYHHPDGARVAYRETGTGPGLVLLHSALLSHREFEPVVEHLADRFRLDPPRPAAARRLRGPPAPPLHAGLARRGASPPSAWRPPGRARWSAATTSARRSCCARSSRAARRPARLVLMPNRAAPPARPRETLARRRRALGAVPGPRPRADPRRARRVPARARRASSRARGDPAARDLVRHAFADVGGNVEPRALVGALRHALAARPAPRAARPLPAPATSRCCCCGPTRTAATRCRRPRRRSTCCPTRSCACSAAPASSSPTTTRSGSARELAAFCG